MSTASKYLPADKRRAATVEAVIQLAATQNPSDITTAAIAGHMHLTRQVIAERVKSRIGFTPLVKVVEIGVLPRSEKKAKRVIDTRYE